MPLDPQAKIIIDFVNSLGLSFAADTDPVAMRAMMDAAVVASSIEVAHVEDREIPGPFGPIPVRIYRPAGAVAKPVIVYYHGGGWTVGSVSTHDDVCRALAAGVDAVVVSVDYRLAPEHRFPAAVDDAWAALLWVHTNAEDLGGDPARLAVAGDSSGGNLAAVVAIKARPAGPDLRFQLLVYPVTDHEFTSVSMEDNAEGYFLTRDTMRWFYEQYLDDPAQGDDPDVSPIRAENLADLPPTFLVAAEYDPLRDQGLAYADALRAAGNTVEVKVYSGMFHGFFNMGSMMDAARAANDEAVAALRAGLV